MGMIIGVPVTAVIISFVERLTKAKLKKKELPEDPDCYLNVAKITEEGQIEPYTYTKPNKEKSEKNNTIVKALRIIFRAIGRFFVWIYNFIKAFFVKMSENKKNNDKKKPEEKPVKDEVVIEDFSAEQPAKENSVDDDEIYEDSSADDKNFPDTLV